MSEITDPNVWLITGANGNLGKRLIETLLHDRGDTVVAVVRSERAEQALKAMRLDEMARERLQVQVLSYTDVDALRAAATDCNKAVHLVGILKETRQAKYEDAHEASTAALLQALAGTSVEHLVYMSIVGSSAGSGNACLASKGAAEDLCRGHPLPACILRVPMVLGEGDYASYALRSRASKRLSFTFRAASLEQPIYAGDVVRAIIAAAMQNLEASVDLGGPEVLSRRDLTERAAAVLHTHGQVASLPIWLGRAFAGVLQSVLGNPPMTATMLDVLDHDDAIDPENGVAQLGMDPLTPLDDTLRAVLV
jgi:NADH dehydrogenase